jgi:tripartite-type tricarboxylate transporter receptor subunit TctC
MQMKMGLAMLFGLLMAAGAHAQPAPAPLTPVPLMLVIGGPPGTPADLVARTISGPLAAELGQSVVVENRPGAAGTVALAYLVRARADGNTLGTLALQSAAAATLVRTLPYDLARDLAPVRQLTTVSNLLVVHADSPMRSVADVLAAARAGGLAYASGGNGTPAHLAAELFAQEGRVRMQHVPFNGPVAGLTALAGGHVQLMFATAPATAALLQSGKLRALATTAPARLAAQPDVPTLAESGLPTATVRDWHGLVVPAGTPRSRVEQLAAALERVMAQEGVRQRLMAAGLEPVMTSGPDEFRRWTDAETQRWRAVIEKAGISMQ